MKFYDEIAQVNLDDDSVDKARKFAEEVISTINYSDSNQVDKKKILNDHFISKLGEEAVKIIFQSFAKVSGPDYTIYQSNQKNWADDLYINNIGLAVKTQKTSMANKYGLSWTFQSGVSRKDIILNKPDAWVVFVEYDDTKPHNCKIFPAFQIKELIFGESKLSHLKDSKKIVYADTLVYKK